MTNNSERKHISFVSVIEKPCTKTSLVQDEDVFRIYWKEDDVIKVFSESETTGSDFEIDRDQSESDMSVVFTGEISGDAPYAAIYPAYGGAKYNPATKSISFSLPQTQNYDYFTFADGANPEVAYLNSGNELKFKNLCGVLRLCLKGDVTISRIDLYDNDPYANLWGSVSVNAETLATAVTNDDVVERNHIIVDCGTGLELSSEETTTIHFVLPAGSLSSGFTVKLTAPSGAAFTANTAIANPISRSVVRIMPELNVTQDKLVLPYVSLDADDENANCYLIAKAGNYKFKAVKGNSSLPISGIESAVVLWESFGNNVAPSAGDLVRSILYEDGEVRFSTPDVLKDGNALIAVKDGNGDILWSWHIWICEGYDPLATKQAYAHNAGELMDRNLGATSATPGDVRSFGLLYQWGRKDPFLSSGTNTEGDFTSAASTLVWPAPMASSSTIGTIDYATKNPTTFIYAPGSSLNNDWLYSATVDMDYTRWTSGSSKTIYDPCPAGWHVANGGDAGVWAVAMNTIGIVTDTDGSLFDVVNRGVHLPASIAGADAWYPCAPSLSSGGEGLSAPGDGEFSIQSRTPDIPSRHKVFKYVTDTKKIGPCLYGFGATGRAVRCQREGTGSGIPVTIPVKSVTLSSSALAMETGAESLLTATVNPSDATNKVITWTTSNSSVATVSEGLVTAVGSGTATITASCDGKTATCTVTVKMSFWTYILEKYDTNNDGQMNASEIAAVTNLTVPKIQFNNYNGIDKLTSLSTLNIGSNNVVTSLDLSKNTALTYVYAGDCSKLASIKLSSLTNMPCILVSRTTKFTAGSTSRSLSCASKFVVMSNGTSSPLALDLTPTTGYYIDSGVPTQAQALVLIDKFPSYRNLIDASLYNRIANMTCWTSTVESSNVYNGETYYHVYIFRLTGTASGIDIGRVTSTYETKNILKVKVLK